MRRDLFRARRAGLAVTAGATCLVLGACAGAGPQLPSLAALSTAALPKMPVPEPGVVAASSVEVYSRIARGANRCWFGAGGRLKSTHMLHADAESPQKGGAVEIVVHERAVDQPKPWGFKAYRVSISESGGHSSFTAENMRMSDDEDRRMRSEVVRWATGGEDCEVPVAVAAPPAEEPKAKATAKTSAAKAPAGKAEVKAAR